MCALTLLMGLALSGLPEGDATIRAKAGFSEIVITTTSRLAGAIHSLTWGGMEFIDSVDHGRQLQSASNLDAGEPFHPEVFNPTEAGSRHDGAGPNSTSKLLKIHATGDELSTTTQMAFWLAPGEKSEGHLAVNKTMLSEHLLSKRVKIGHKGLPQAIEYDVTFTVPEGEKHTIGQFEALTGYMPLTFDKFWTYDPHTKALNPLTDGPGEQPLPVVFSTENGSHAMGIFSPEKSPGYGRFRFVAEKVVKWNCVFRHRDPKGIKPGPYSYKMFVAVGTLDEVKQTLGKLLEAYPTPVNFHRCETVMSTHGFGIIGCGMIAEFHVKAIAEIEGAKVLAAFSRSATNGAKIANLVGGECKIYDDLDAMLAHPGIDVVCVCTPSGAHLDPAVKAAKAGKHVVVEKPLEITLPRCDAIIEACDQAGVRLCTIFPSRFSPANVSLKQAIDLGRFGRLTLGDTYVKWWRTQEYYDSGGWRGTWDLDGGGALMNQAIHNVDLLQWLMGGIASVQAMTATLVHERIEVEDTAVVAIRFKNGALGVIEAATSAFPGILKRTEIHGEHGSARVDQDDITLWQFAAGIDDDDAIQHTIAMAKAGASSGASDPRGITHTGHRSQLADFLRAIDANGKAMVDGREGRKSVEIIRAIYKSAKTGMAVALPFTDEQ